MKQKEDWNEKAHAQIAHLVFADTQNINPKKPKELFLATARRNRLIVVTKSGYI